MNNSRLQQVIERSVEDREITGTVVALSAAGDGTAWVGATGDASTDTPFFVASTTKLYTTALIMRLCERGQLELGQRLVDLLPSVDTIHRSPSNDRATTERITVKDLLAHTSGLPDYFQDSRGRKRSRASVSLESQLRNGEDRSWSFEEVVEWTAEMEAPFDPGRGRRAHYSDTNYQLLGRIISELTGKTYAKAVQHEILEPLGLDNTWLFVDPNDTRPLPLRDGMRQLDIPQAMTSFGPDGGMVADVGDLMIFLRGFFEGRLFDRNAVPITGQEFRRIMFPLRSGVGVIRFQMPRILAPFGPRIDLVGHSGLSGAFAFFAPNHQVYVAGTVNNLAKPRRAYQLMVRLLNAID